MHPITGAAIFLTLWWVVLFVILPLGVRSHAEAGIEVKDGGDPGAPVDPKLKRKFVTTTLVTTGLFLLILAAVKLGLLDLSRLAPPPA